ncbi:GNAT family N-acetyltransferase [Arcanobacterium buesumense]|uniref:GNAT family N-acetyltransferase n=1 Tax=Arcanobacterium buesumense TaxID=2722751 RepID=A0A6H2EK18_9ACTO|nr:GNAT family N-acetyltransferase [Arcanobacterium buesumense]QJC21686.1 GNAT family N-acetyltransferase [Arcanobacterium buesumense]
MKTTKQWIWSELSAAHVDDLIHLISTTEEYDKSPIRTSAAEVASYFGSTHYWRAQGAWLGEELIAFGLARLMADGSRDYTITLSGAVHPQQRSQGVGAELLERQVSVAHELAQTHSLDQAHALLYVDADHENVLNLAKNKGFVWQATFVQVRGETHIHVPTQKLSDYVTIDPLTDELIEDVRRMHNLVVLESALFDIQTAESWALLLEDMDREWCVVAIDRFGDRPRVIGYLLASVFVSMVDGREKSEAYIDEVVVSAQWRNSGVGSAMINTVLERFAASGYDSVVADVAVADPKASAFMDVFDANGFSELGRTQVMSLVL